MIKKGSSYGVNLVCRLKPSGVIFAILISMILFFHLGLMGQEEECQKCDRAAVVTKAENPDLPPNYKIGVRYSIHLRVLRYFVVKKNRDDRRRREVA
ncbi:MAG: hypothetical protein GTO45_04530 [Candidatus Aminicenantes bacterium]|nr:hypothetical protein [Candidatus Aminicenantes bacterium]NIN17337.1 hypothetical protein [Candidatus Aminicenantes bacterium]NIN41229.1 hypothetical protein [Candidatus Aminicenantes bacterium]NIN84003.1 hypothetical protein [Candidatus Aminicenantes bacterium]NIO79936.1 hypothetical protein [Candidatus Aminicenantes bacterium]